VEPDLVGADDVPGALLSGEHQEPDARQRRAERAAIFRADLPRRTVELGEEAALGVRRELELADQLFGARVHALDSAPV